MKNKLREKIIKRTDKSISDDRYVTTSFTLLKEDYVLFKATCKTMKRKPSVVLREMILIVIEEGNNNDQKD
jgi:hypothetical protein